MPWDDKPDSTYSPCTYIRTAINHETLEREIWGTLGRARPDGEGDCSSALTESPSSESFCEANTCAYARY